jgi:hypothetical protein
VRLLDPRCTIGQNSRIEIAMLFGRCGLSQDIIRLGAIVCLSFLSADVR